MDLTTGSPFKKIMLFTIPLLIGNFFQQMYSFSDTLIVGRTLGENALGAVGSTSSLQFLVLGFANGLTVGLAIITAQKFGAKDIVSVRRSFAMSILITAMTSVIVTILALMFLPQILHLMQTPKVLYDDTYAFIFIIFAGIFTQMAYNLLANIYRAVGNSLVPLIFLIVGQILNIILELWFILGLHMGVAGAGYATGIAQLMSAIFLIIWIPKHLPQLALSKEDFKLTKFDFIEHARIAYPVAFQSSIIAIGSVILQMSLNILGPKAVTATSAAAKIDQFAVLIFMSFGTTMATYTAQNYGAKQFKRILLGTKYTLIASIGAAVLLGIFEITFSNYMVAWFIEPTGNEEVFKMAHTYFEVVGTTYIMLSILFVVRNVLQGAGNSITPTLAGIGELLARGFAGIVLAPAFGYFGAMLANPLAWSMSVLIMLVPFVKLISTLKKEIMMEENNLVEKID